MVRKKASPATQYQIARSNLWAVTAFTALNVILSAFSDTYFLFSASIPYFLALVGKTMYLEAGGLLAYMIVGCVIGLILTVPYLLCAIFGKKHRGWMIAALVLFSIDTILMFLLFGLTADMIFDYLFHAWVLYYLIVGVVNGNHAGEEATEPVIADGETEFPAAEPTVIDEYASFNDGFEETATPKKNEEKSDNGDAN